MKKQLLRFLPLIILLVGAGGVMGLVSSGQAPERRVMPDLGPLVESLAADLEGRRTLAGICAAVLDDPPEDTSQSADSPDTWSSGAPGHPPRRSGGRGHRRPAGEPGLGLLALRSAAAWRARRRRYSSKK